jgi:hypothetical protein
MHIDIRANHNSVRMQRRDDTVGYPIFSDVFWCAMNDDYFKEQSRRVRGIADTADPFTKQRLLALVAAIPANFIIRKGGRWAAFSPPRWHRLHGISPEVKANIDRRLIIDGWVDEAAFGRLFVLQLAKARLPT